MKCLVFALMIFPFSPNAPAANNFQWCRSIEDRPESDFIHAKVPALPKDYQTNSHFQKDGDWDFDLPVDKVWKLYTETPMNKIWASHWIVYRFAMAPGSSVHVTEDTPWPKLNQGTRMFFDIKALLRGRFCNMAIGFEVTKVIPQTMIQLDYLDFSPPYGMQWMYFKKISATKTRVTQYSQYQGKDLLIDLNYPIFHNEEIPLLHESLQKISKTFSTLPY